MTIEVGMKYTAELTVALENTAKAVGSGELEVFATPMMAALMEKAAYMAIAPALPEGDSSVGCELKISHVSATPVGMAVRAEAEVTAVEGKMIHYTVKAFDERGLIGEGTHVRALVHSDRFLERTNNK